MTVAVPTPRTLAPGLASVLLLAALAAVGQFASNVYIPSLPAVATDLGVAPAAAQVTFVAFVAALAAGQLIAGPLADRLGRRPALFAGLAVFLMGTIGCATAPSIEALALWRAVQGFGAAAGLVVSRAATRDSFEGTDLTRTLAAVTIAFALVPGLAPLMGGLIQVAAGWRAVFWTILAAGLAVTLWAALRLPETRSQGVPTPVLASYRTVLRDLVFLGLCVTAGLVFAAMNAFFAASPALFIERLGVGPAEYGLYPPLAVSGFVVGGIVVRRLAGRVAPRRIAGTGLGLMVLALMLMTALPLVGVVRVWTFNVAMVLNVTGLGVFLPTTIAMALERHPGRAGTAAALQGFVQLSLGAVGALVASFLQPALPILAMPLTMLGAVVLAALAFLATSTTAATRKGDVIPH